ncbi:MAG: GNAT family N-acetyltransferase [Bacteroidales bacterium]|nr:GNAT family N-acetyltransferase [Bacteroidales bacterium]
MVITEVTPQNAEKEGLFCIKNPKYPGFKLKLNWLEKRQKEGLKFKLLKDEKEVLGFIEYVPGEYAWRPVEAAGYLFIHCLWVFPKKNLGKGFGSTLLQHVFEEAVQSKKSGVAVVSSPGSWMSSPDIFAKNGFAEIHKKERFVLMARKSGQFTDPCFVDWEKNLPNYQGLNLVYANQCPLFIKSVDEMKRTAFEQGHELKVKVLESSEEIRNSASGYGVYSLVYNGKLLADHYISNTRFKNILNKELPAS